MKVVVILISIVWISVFNGTNGRLVSSSDAREYLLHVPDSYDSTTPAPLIIGMHAGATWPAQQKNLSRWNLDRHAAVCLQHRPGADLRRRMSNGGGMAFVVSCALSDRIAAVGMVAPPQSLPLDWCTATRPVPMIAVHGTADPMVPYGGGRFAFNPVKPIFPAVGAFVARWAERDRCVAGPIESPVAHDVTSREHADCADGASVVLYTVAGGGHTWPGGKALPEWRVGPNSRSLDATSEMWAFFREHPLRGDPYR